MINKLIIDTLASLSIPVCLHEYEGNNSTYIIFYEYLEKEEDWADDEETIIGHYIQLKIFSKSNLSSIAKQTKVQLKSADFKYKWGKDSYNKDTNMYSKVMRFAYYEIL